MRFLRISYRYFGPFEEKTFDLSEGKEGLHLFYGPNEAGKSTALRGVRYLLFGFPKQCHEEFRYPARKQQLEAHLRTRSGEELAFVRMRKKNPLQRLPNGEDLPAVELQRFLAGLTEEQFHMLFGLDHGLLVEGGRQIVEGKGDLGQALFAAGAGMAGLRRLQKALAEKIQNLYTPRSSKGTKINPLLDEIQQKRDEQEKATLRFETWQQQVQEYQKALDERNHFIAQQEEMQKEIRRLQKCQNLLEKVLRFQNVSQQLQNLPDRDPILDEQQTIQSLREELGKCRKANEDRRHLATESQKLKDQALGILKGSFGQETLEELHLLCPSEEARNRIQKLIEERKACLEAHEKAQAKLKELVATRQELEKNLSELPSTDNGEQLQACWETVLQEGPLESTLRQIENQLTEFQCQAELLLQELKNGWTGSLEEAVSLRPPPEERVEEYKLKFEDLQVQRQSCQEKMEELQKTIRSAERAIRQLEKVGQIPTEEALQEARRHRDALLEMVRTAWQQPDQLDQAQADALIQQYAPGAHLLDALQKSIQHADHLADRLRQEAHRVAERASQEQRRSEAIEELQVLQQKLDQLQHQTETLHQAWQAEWAPWDITAQSPREMLGWVQKHRELVKIIRTFRTLQEQKRQVQDQIVAARNRLQTALGLPEVDPEQSLQELLQRAKHRMTELENQRKKRQQWEAQLTQVCRDQEKMQEEVALAASRLDQWRSAWDEAIRNLRVPQNALPETVYCQLRQLEEIRSLLQKAQALDDRIAGIDKDTEAFLYRLSQVRVRLNSDSSASTLQSMEADIDALEARLHGALEVEARRQTLQEEYGPLCQELLREAGSKPLEEFCTEILQQADAIPDRLDKLQKEAETLEEAIRRVSEQVGRGQHQLEIWQQARDDAAQLYQERMALVAQLRELTLEYAASQLAQRILAQAVENFRQRHQDTLLSRASKYFQLLTCQAFQKLEVVEGQNDKPVLKAVRGTPTDSAREEEVDLEGLSDGTRDQLFLALRLAGIEEHCDRGEPMPVIIDDVLINFDNLRAVATLKALAELSKKVQILLFTHHEHIVDLAKQHLPTEVLFCYCF